MNQEIKQGARIGDKLSRIVRYMSFCIHEERNPFYADAIWSAGFIVGNAYSNVMREIERP